MEVELRQNVVAVQRSSVHLGVPDAVRLVLVAVAVVVEVGVAGDLVVLDEVDSGAAGGVVSVQVDRRLVLSPTVLSW